jgi:hypothetical protein
MHVKSKKTKVLTPWMRNFLSNIFISNNNYIIFITNFLDIYFSDEYTYMFVWNGYGTDMERGWIQLRMFLSGLTNSTQHKDII